MENKHIDSLNEVFDNLPAMDSENRYATPQRPGGVLRLPSHRSGFAAVDESASEVSSNAPDSPWSPPAWRPPESSSAWYRHQPYLQDSPMARSSGRYSASVREGSTALSASVLDDDLTVPANIPLPRGSESPSKGLSPEPQAPSRHTSPEKVDTIPEETEDDDATTSGKLASYIRFSLRADVQQRSEPLEQAILSMRSIYQNIVSSKSRLLLSALGFLIFAIALRLLFSPPSPKARPDLIKVANFASSFETMIHYSERGVGELSGLQETGTAVWDLTESVRIANFTSSPIIVKELDSLYDSLTRLGTELTGFFAAIDGDFDNILLVMDWARRELAYLETVPAGRLSSAIGNLHSGLQTVGLLSRDNPQDARNMAFALVFGTPNTLRAELMLHKAFNEVMGTLESSIESEVSRATAIASIYAAIEQQFANVKRAAAREEDVQVSAEAEILSSLWQRALGGKSTQLRKFERNQDLLRKLKDRTTVNQKELKNHVNQLNVLKMSLEVMRRQMISPMMKMSEMATSVQGLAIGNGMGLGEQVKRLEETGDYLKKVRQQQKARVLDVLYNVGKQRSATLEIDGGL